MNLINNIKQTFTDSIELKQNAVLALTPLILDAGNMLVDCIKTDNKILTCGNGGSACDAQHFTGELVNRFMIERDGLPAISLTADAPLLTAIANDYAYQDIFSKQIKALGKGGDVLLAISTSGKSPNVINAIKQAHRLNIRVILLTGEDSPAIRDILSDDDIVICVPSKATPRIQEVHILIIHCLCDLIDKRLFGA